MLVSMKLSRLSLGPAFQNDIFFCANAQRGIRQHCTTPCQPLLLLPFSPAPLRRFQSQNLTGRIPAELLSGASNVVSWRFQHNAFMCGPLPGETSCTPVRPSSARGSRLPVGFGVQVRFGGSHGAESTSGSAVARLPSLCLPLTNPAHTRMRDHNCGSGVVCEFGSRPLGAFITSRVNYLSRPTRNPTVSCLNATPRSYVCIDSYTWNFTCKVAPFRGAPPRGSSPASPRSAIGRVTALEGPQ